MGKTTNIKLNKYFQTILAQNQTTNKNMGKANKQNKQTKKQRFSNYSGSEPKNKKNTWERQNQQTK